MMLRRAACCTAAILLAGCELIKAAEEPVDLYTITPKSTFEGDMPAVTWQLSVDVPTAAANVNTGRIALAHSLTSSDYYTKTAWTDRAPVMVQTRIVDSFENSHKIVAVARESIGLRANYVLQTDLRNFEAMYFYGGTPIVKVRIVAKLVRMPDRQIIGVATFERCVRARADKVPKEVEAFDPKPGLFYYELGERLESRRHFDPAEKFFKLAVEQRPMLPWPYNSLGLLYMRMGREKDARPILDKAFKERDPFNVRVSNSLKVLRHLEKYETHETAHFALRFDPKLDTTLARFMGAMLEDIYADLAVKFQYAPRDPILVEVFNTHEMFSGRTIALPDLHTIGACTGRMVAMVSPHGKGVRKAFNWGRVLRHELVHRLRTACKWRRHLQRHRVRL